VAELAALRELSLTRIFTIIGVWALIRTRLGICSQVTRQTSWPAVTKQIEILKPQLGEARAQLAKATAWLIEVKSKPAAVSNAIAQLKEAQSNSTQASTTVGVLSNANDALGATLASNTTGSRDTPLALKEWAKRQKD
jgi:hypothetical protein